MRFLGSLMVLGMSCSDYEIKQQTPAVSGVSPEIDVSPGSLSFAAATVDVPEDQVVSVSNIGSGNLDISSLQILGSGTFSFTGVPSSGTIAPGAKWDVIVSYAPLSEGAEDEASLIIQSNDRSESTVEVPLWGALQQPELAIIPSQIEFGTVLVGEEDTQTFTLHSVGDAPLTLNSWSISGNVFRGDPAETWPLVLAPGEVTTVDVTYVPPDGRSHLETFSVDVDDPAVDQSATVSGNAQLIKPVAVCEVSPTEVQPNGGSATWLGSGSYDDSGAQIVDYHWTLNSKPTGSQVIMQSGGADRGPFYPDLAGDYVAELVVTNDLGFESDPCEVTLMAVPGQDLWIQMSWTHAGDDMDLHLTRNNGSVNTTDDCYYGNCVGGNSWGASLDMDDIPGTGPENITMQTPAAGTYRVSVHDFPSSVNNTPNDVEVTIFLGGVQVWTDTRTIRTEDSYTDYAEISYPSATITPL